MNRLRGDLILYWFDVVVGRIRVHTRVLSFVRPKLVPRLLVVRLRRDPDSLNLDRR